MNAPASKKVQIRMYNVGFGDCFLIMLPSKKTILVDCGFHSQGKGEFDGNSLAEQVIEDVERYTGEKRIDVVVASHRHQDHVYGFNSNAWDDVEIGEVWLPWVDDRKNPEATKLWKKKQAFALQLVRAIGSQAPVFRSLTDEQKEELKFLAWNAGADVDGFVGPAFAAWSNKGALDTLIDGFASRDRAEPRYLPATDQFPETFTTPSLPNVKIHVLGPARDPDAIEHLDPADDDETYRVLFLGLLPAQLGGTDGAPFGPMWIASSLANEVPILAPDEIDRLTGLAEGGDALFAAKKLDSMINSTSLVLILEIGKHRLLLPGDAEWGTWKRILENDKSRALLRKTTFLKVGHHGSHNATPKTLVDEVLHEGIHAMISTQKGPGSYRNNIPLSDLIDALDQRHTKLVRSDEDEAVTGYVRDAKNRWVDLKLSL